MQKPKNKHEAINMLKQLSGNIHKVITGVCITSKNKQLCFGESTEVTFRKLSEAEIEYYIEKYQPFISLLELRNLY